MVRLGVADAYECGIYDRIYAWLDADRCLMHTEGRCVKVFRFRFSETVQNPLATPDGRDAKTQRKRRDG